MERNLLIELLEDGDKVSLYSPHFEGEEYSEFEKFLLAYKDMAHGQKTADVQRDNDYTTQVLYRLGFDWSPTSWDYVERMLTAIGGFGFFE